VVFVRFRVLPSGNPRKLMACFLPFRPWIPLDLRVFGFQPPRESYLSPRPLLSCTSTPPCASFPHACRPSTSERRCRNSRSKSASLELPCPSAFPDPQSAFLRIVFRRNVRMTLPSHPEDPHTGFGYPLCGFRSKEPRRPLSAPNALGLLPSELFSSRVIGFRFPRISSALGLP
jgi:hypothetical protein